MRSAVNIALIPDFFKLSQVQSFIRRQFPRLFQHRLPDLLTPAFRPGLIDLQGFEENILFAVHNSNQIFQALTVMIRSVHMNVQAAGTVDFCPCSTYLPDAFLKLGKLRISQLRSHHFHAILTVTCGSITRGNFAFRTDAAVAHQFPLFSLRVLHCPCVVSTSIMNG